MEKKICFLLLVINAIFSAKAEYLPIMEDGKDFFFKEVYVMGDEDIPDKIYVSTVAEDVTIDGYKCKRMISKNLGTYEIFRERYFYEKDGVLYIVPDIWVDQPEIAKKKDISWIPIIDMNLEEGDHFTNTDLSHYDIDLLVSNVDYIWLDGAFRKRIVLKTSMESPYISDIWIEGLGMNDNCFESLQIFCVSVDHFVECRHNGRTVCISTDFTKDLKLTNSVHGLPTNFSNENFDSTDNYYTITGLPIKTLKNTDSHKIYIDKKRRKITIP